VQFLFLLPLWHLWEEPACQMVLGPQNLFPLVPQWGYKWHGPGPGSHGALPRCLNYVLEEVKHNAKAEVMAATHNEDTVRFTLRR
jgi:hypothetical protein